MRLITEEPNLSSIQLLEDQEVPLSDALKATAQLTWTESISPSAIRSVEQDRAEKTAFGELVNRRGRKIKRKEPPKQDFITQEDALSRATDEGVTLEIPERGISDFKLNELIRLQKEQQLRESVSASFKGEGFGAGAARFGVSFGTALLDPANIAAAFVPVVGEARYAVMLSRATGGLGRLGVRARVGAIEGAAGAALVEPVILSQAIDEQRDYDLTDSFLNVAFGTVFGGGLHMGFGAIGDAVKARKQKISDGTITPEELATPVEHTTQPVSKTAEHVNSLTPQQREILGRTAVYQMSQGKEVNIEALIASMDEVNGPSLDEIEVSVKQDLEAEFKVEAEVKAKEISKLDKDIKTLQESKKPLTDEKLNLEKARKNIKDKAPKSDKKLSKTERSRRKQERIKAKEAEIDSRLNEVTAKLNKVDEDIQIKSDTRTNLEDPDVEAARNQERINREVNKRSKGFKKNPLSQAVSDATQQFGLGKSLQESNDAVGAGSLPEVAAQIEARISEGLDENVDLNQAQKWLDEVTEEINELPEDLRVEGQKILDAENAKVAEAQETSLAIKSALSCKGRT